MKLMKLSIRERKTIYEAIYEKKTLEMGSLLIKKLFYQSHMQIKHNILNPPSTENISTEFTRKFKKYKQETTLHFV